MANRMAAVVSEDSGAFTMGSLFGELGGELTRQNISDITEALIEEGMDERTAKKNARILWYVVKNGPVSALQTAMIERNDVLAKVMREVVIDPYCTVDPQSIGYNEILRQLARETVARESGYRLEMWDPDYAASAAGGGEGRTGLPGGGVTAAAAAVSQQREAFGNGWQETHGAAAYERNGANWEAAHGAGADALDAGSSFDQRQAENAADWEVTEDFPVEESAEHGIINAGATGAYNEKNDPDGSKSDAHASRYYESVRNSRKEFVVNTISRNTGIGSEKVSKMFDHLFINEYDLDRGHVRFDADYDIAESIQRLRDGKNIQTHDLILIHHEAMEYDLMNKEGLGYEEAHERANRVYNYQEALEKWDDQSEK